MSDLISRHAAVDAINRLDIPEDMCVFEILSHIELELGTLPSAQPEQRWIPCSDENPKADGRYLITGKMGTVYSLDFEDGRWYGGIKPVAWMPLPEPYRGERTEE